MKIIVAPDKFKDSLDSFQLCDAIAEGIATTDPLVEIIKLPLADGGDGFAKVLASYLHTSSIQCTTVDALHRPFIAGYEWSAESKTAIIELAAASGLALLNYDERNPMLTSTYGTGLLMKDAVDRGAKKIIIGIGGSATNDGAAGLLSALGYRFLNSKGEDIHPRGENLAAIQKILLPANPVRAEVVIACDVDNPLLGTDGAAYTYASQKGATENQIDELEQGMLRFSKVMEAFSYKNIAAVAGSGAAGGTGAGLLLLPDVSLMRGIDIVMQKAGLQRHLPDTALVITAEGSFDEQTLHGKTMKAVCSTARNFSVPVIAICGKVDAGIATIINSGFAYITSIANGPISLEESKRNAFQLVKVKAASIVNFIKQLYSQAERTP